MEKLCFGTAGVPLSSKKKDTISGIERIKELGLDSMEIEFVRGVNISEKSAIEIGKAGRDLNIVLTAHGPYFINLSSLEEDKIEKSIERVIKTAIIGELCGAKKFTFHLGYYQKQDPIKVYETMKTNILRIIEVLKEKKCSSTMSPETAGKLTSFGSLDEILSLCNEIKDIKPCIDFAHLFARTNGEYNSYSKFSEILEKIQKSVGRNYFNDVYFHISGIEFGKQGEKKHLTLDESQFNYKDLLRLFKEYDLKGIIVCESPILEEDALKMKEFYYKI